MRVYMCTYCPWSCCVFAFLLHASNKHWSSNRLLSLLLRLLQAIAHCLGRKIYAESERRPKFAGPGRQAWGVLGWKLFGILDLGVEQIWVEIFPLAFNNCMTLDGFHNFLSLRERERENNCIWGTRLPVMINSQWGSNTWCNWLVSTMWMAVITVHRF